MAGSSPGGCRGAGGKWKQGELLRLRLGSGTLSFHPHAMAKVSPMAKSKVNTQEKNGLVEDVDAERG